ncbi:hypothetical protein GGR50DRAFT_671019 [Xylaria sp. CBS 124048]|nr:hypothetical protein GGR50DRAFT_671019 [Xylaria sp. CBS 124048]
MVSVFWFTEEKKRKKTSYFYYFFINLKLETATTVSYHIVSLLTDLPDIVWAMGTLWVDFNLFTIYFVYLGISLASVGLGLDR